MPTLRPKELCPLHRRRDCCGRAEFARYMQVKKPRHGIWVPVRSGLWRAADGREKRSPRELRRLKDDYLRKGIPCAACGQGFSDYRDAELAHRHGKGSGGAFRDDSPKNTTLLHAAANRAQGSMALDVYLKDHWKESHCHG